MAAAQSRETIIAMATPPGRGGVGVLRLSGPAARSIAEQMVGPLPAARVAALRDFCDRSGVIDQGLVICFEAPHSYTGEHVVELQGHGGPILLDLLTAEALRLGARLAEPGEFTQRAYLNDRMDLAAAEAVADLINSRTAAAARAALRSLSGDFSSAVEALAAGIGALRVEVEAGIDFTDEDIDPADAHQQQLTLRSLRLDLQTLLKNAQFGRRLQEGCTVVIAGRPNAGKSSLLNRLAGHDAAIVTPIPGTTRDVLREHIELNGLPIQLIDTAGLRDTADLVEAEGIRRARAEMTAADHILFLIDANDPVAVAAAPADIGGLPPDLPLTRVYTKADLVNGVPDEGLALSMHDRQSIETLSAHLVATLVGEPLEGVSSARRRHLDALARCDGHLLAALEDALPGDLIAEELRLAQVALGEITGSVTSDDLLGQIFSTFCIGK